MSNRIVPIAVGLFTVACLTTAPVALAADLTLEGFAGWQHLQALPSTLARPVNGKATVGGDILEKFSLFGLGLSLDKTVSDSARPWAGSVMLGLLFDLLPNLRLEALGEVGRYGSSFGAMFGSNGQTFLGFRPTVSFRLFPTPVRFGVATLIRWPTSGSNLGSPNYGFVGKVGIELP